jgi:hypothetical protein
MIIPITRATNLDFTSWLRLDEAVSRDVLEQDRIVLPDDLVVFHGTCEDKAEAIAKTMKLRADAPKVSGGTLDEKGLIWFFVDPEPAKKYAKGAERHHEHPKIGRVFTTVIPKGTRLLNRYAALTDKEAEKLNAINPRKYDPIKPGHDLYRAMYKYLQWEGKDRPTMKDALGVLGYDGIVYFSQDRRDKDEPQIGILADEIEVREEPKHRVTESIKQGAHDSLWHGTTRETVLAIAEGAFQFQGYWVNLNTKEVYETTGDFHGLFILKHPDLFDVDAYTRDAYEDAVENKEDLEDFDDNAEQNAISSGDWARVAINGSEVNIQAFDLGGIRKAFGILLDDDDDVITLTSSTKLVYDTEEDDHGTISGPVAIDKFLFGKKPDTSPMSAFREAKAPSGVEVLGDGSVKITDFDAISMTQYGMISRKMKARGYDWRGPEDAKTLMTRMGKREITSFYGDHADVIKSVLKLGPYAVDDAKQAEKKVWTIAKRYFGVTDQPRAAGYLLPDGSWLDFSGCKHGSCSRNTRAYDHRQLGQAYVGKGFPDLEKGGMEAMYDFMQRGAIRLLSDNGFDLIVQPTSKQYGSLNKWLQHMANDEVVQIDVRASGTHVSHETRPRLAIRDLQQYFSTGAFPKRSEQSKFR